jgi:flagellar assembly protein FliH
MSSWRPLVEALNEVADAAPTVSAESGQTPGGAQESGGEAQGYAKQQMRGRVPTSLFSPQQQEPSEAQKDADAQDAQRRAGYQEGMALARQESEALALRYRQTIDELTQATNKTVRNCEKDLVRLALTIAREVLMADIPGREQFTQRMAEHALGLMGDAQTMTLRISAQDLAAMRQHKPELLRRAGLNWVEDAAVQLGGVVVEADRGKLDATIEGRLSQMAQKLLAESPEERL